MNKCYLCGGKLERKNVNIARYWGKELIALNDVPALICQKCVERFFEAKISNKIDEKIKGVLENKKIIPKINIPVVQFS